MGSQNTRLSLAEGIYTSVTSGNSRPMSMQRIHSGGVPLGKDVAWCCSLCVCVCGFVFDTRAPESKGSMICLSRPGEDHFEVISTYRAHINGMMLIYRCRLIELNPMVVCCLPIYFSMQGRSKLSEQLREKSQTTATQNEQTNKQTHKNFWVQHKWKDGQKPKMSGDLRWPQVS